MLYVTTRNNSDVYTAQWVLTGKRGADGGLYVPFRLPKFSMQEIAGFAEKNFNQRLSEILNLLFGSHVTAYDIDFTLGRQSVRLRRLGQKIMMGECWHNTDWCFNRMVKDLSELVRSDAEMQIETDGWAETGVRIAVLFGIFGELLRSGIASTDNLMDVSVVSGDFSAPMSAWYAREMGLPIGNIVCCCNDNSGLWNFICHGQLRTDAVAKRTVVPEADIVIPEGLERLISVYGGPEEVSRYVDTLRQGGTYYTDDALLCRMRKGIYVTVSSEKCILETIPRVYGTHGYLMGPAAALAYAGLQDYRARTRSSSAALILTEKSVSCDADVVADALGIRPSELWRYIKEHGYSMQKEI